MPFIRFPKWHFCQNRKCRRMISIRKQDEIPESEPLCKREGCRGKLVPMRFVTVCEQGHLGEVPWNLWAHINSKSPRQDNCSTNEYLEFRTRRGAGGGLSATEVHCRACGARNSLNGIASLNSLQNFNYPCSGRQPWQKVVEAVDCEVTPQVCQRGASNIYFPRVASALDIRMSGETGEDEGRKNILAHRLYDTIKKVIQSVANPERSIRDDKGSMIMVGMIAEDTGCSEEFVISTVESSSVAEVVQNVEERKKRILPDEWVAFLNPIEDQKPTDQFVTETLNPATGVDTKNPVAVKMAGFFEEFILVKRLREVRALEGFERYKTTGNHVIKPDLGKGRDWLPGQEVFGEGVLIRIDENRISSWESDNHELISPRIERARRTIAEQELRFLPAPTARFILLHTLAHLLIRQISFECGYASASLRERIYSAAPGERFSPMAGILIYTADSDSEGSLGGLVEEGRPERLVPNIVSAVVNAEWCSNDPICGEIEGQGLAGLNRAACHACALISETSCIHCNTLLDRGLVTGTRSGQTGPKGFFEDIIAEILSSEL
ncbi:DUF1998 domain-containing protein [bacterium]|nr:DUF1998 domain-containing protein [bacterium]